MIDGASLLIAPVPIIYPSGIPERRQGYPLLVSQSRGFMCLGVWGTKNSAVGGYSHFHRLLRGSNLELSRNLHMSPCVNHEHSSAIKRRFENRTSRREFYNTAGILLVRVPGYRSRGPGFDYRRYQIF
jgi:hypothetical protein